MRKSSPRNQCNGRNAADLDSFAQRITAAWQAAVASILETGRLLIEAKAELRHGEFGKMIDTRLPFGRRTAQRLMAIASHPVLSKAAHAPLLPPAWYTLYLLTEVPKEELERLLANGKITRKPGISRSWCRATGCCAPPGFPTRARTCAMWSSAWLSFRHAQLLRHDRGMPSLARRLAMLIAPLRSGKRLALMRCDATIVVSNQCSNR